MKCVVLGGTGLIGQQFIRMIAEHPIFELEAIFASNRSSGKALADIWRLPGFECPSQYQKMEIQSLEKVFETDHKVCFSGLPSKVAGEIEEKLRMEGKAVFSNASAHRMDEDVPILIPEINGDHIQVVKRQQERLGTEGFIITNSNCSISGVAIFLHYARKAGNITDAVVSTYQAISGAGFKGLKNPDFKQNVVPFIKQEEEKMISEGQKILGSLTEDLEISPSKLRIHPNCARVSSVDGHLASVTLFHEPLERKIEEVLETAISPLKRGPYHVAPQPPIIVMKEEDRPQPRLDSLLGNPFTARGMAVPVGRIRAEKNTTRAYVLAHNTIRGGSGGSILNAEHALAKGLIRK